MALFLNTNIKALNARRQLSNSANALDSSARRLASGMRINSARDDAAGLQISDRLTSQINGLNQGNRNAQDGISFCQTAEGALDEMTSMFQRIRTLAIQSANGANSAADREAIQQEVSELCHEITRIGEDTTYGGMHIFNKTLTEPTSFQVGADASETIGVDLTSGFRMDDIYERLYAESDAAGQALLQSGVAPNLTYEGGKPSGITVTADASAKPGKYSIQVTQIIDSSTAYKLYSNFDLTVDDGAGNTVTIPYDQRTFGAGTLTFTGGSGSDEQSFTIEVDENDTLDDIINKAKDAKTFPFGTRLVLLSQSGSSEPLRALGLANYAPGRANRPLSVTSSGDDALRIFEFNIGADASEGQVCGDKWKISSVGRDTIVKIDGEYFTSDSFSVYDENRGLNITARSVGRTTVNLSGTTFSVATAEAAQSTLAVVDKFIGFVDSKRAELGAAQNRLESAINNQANIAENLSAARSRIRDTDYASETAELARENILQETSKSILASANHSGDMILSLLQH